MDIFFSLQDSIESNVQSCNTKYIGTHIPFLYIINAIFETGVMQLVQGHLKLVMFNRKSPRTVISSPLLLSVNKVLT